MFDRYFADQVPGWRRRGLMVASLVLHGLVALAIAAWSWSHVVDTTSEVPLTFFAPPPPPPPPKASTPARKTRPKTKVTRMAPTTMLVRYNPKPDRPEPPAETNDDGVEGGAAGGVKGGVVGGTGARVVPQFIADRQRLTSPDPHLPEWFRQQHPRETLKGLYRICVNSDGRVVDAQAVTGIAGVDRFIVDQIRAGWTYKPQPLPFCSTRVFEFRIN